jgi:hypothetical protein
MPETPATASEGSTAIQWFREIVTAVIGGTILLVSALTLYGTWQAAGKTDGSAKDAYERQKDVMLYALALLGTVTGYYLGRVPAEMHAQQAERAATSAQQQLQTTQTQLTETAGIAAAAGSRLSVSEQDKAEAQKRVREARGAMAEVSRVMGQALAPSGPRAGPGVNLESVPEPDPALAEMRRVKEQVDRWLDQTAG